MQRADRRLPTIALSPKRSQARRRRTERSDRPRRASRTAPLGDIALSEPTGRPMTAAIRLVAGASAVFGRRPADGVRERTGSRATRPDHARGALCNSAPARPIRNGRRVSRVRRPSEPGYLDRPDRCSEPGGIGDLLGSLRARSGSARWSVLCWAIRKRGSRPMPGLQTTKRR
jgi:hypothetical protein